jgi:hypothetical protein
VSVMLVFKPFFLSIRFNFTLYSFRYKEIKYLELVVITSITTIKLFIMKKLLFFFPFDYFIRILKGSRKL